ncbi:MAG TPA: (2Fe-2S)-binding protein [Actinomycetes bacterium]
MKQEVNLSMKVNGAPVSVTVEARTLLVQLLRDQLGLTGTKVGCDTSTCGACTVLLDGRSAKSCTLLAAQVSGAAITTIEGLASDDGERLSALQEAFHRHHALQCGYCTPGMIMAATSLLDELGDAPTDAQIRTGLKGNLCRCTGYQHIIDAIQATARSRSGAVPHEGAGSQAEAVPSGHEASPREGGGPGAGAGPGAPGSAPQRSATGSVRGPGASGEEAAR